MTPADAEAVALPVVPVLAVLPVDVEFVFAESFAFCIISAANRDEAPGRTPTLTSTFFVSAFSEAAPAISAFTSALPPPDAADGTPDKLTWKVAAQTWSRSFFAMDCASSPS